LINFTSKKKGGKIIANKKTQNSEVQAENNSTGTKEAFFSIVK